MAIGLLTAVDRHVAAEQIKWLLPNPNGAPVAGGTDHTRACEVIYYASNRLFHLARRYNQVADRTAFRRVTVKPAAHQDGLARYAIACKARHSQVGRTRNDAFFARGKRHEGIASCDHIVHRQKVLAATADRPAINRGNPWFFSRPAVKLIRTCRTGRNPTEHFVHHTHVAADVPEVGNLAAVDVSEIDTARKNSTAFVLWVINDTAAQHPDLA